MNYYGHAELQCHESMPACWNYSFLCRLFQPSVVGELRSHAWEFPDNSITSPPIGIMSREEAKPVVSYSHATGKVLLVIKKIVHSLHDMLFDRTEVP